MWDRSVKCIASNGDLLGFALIKPNSLFDFFGGEIPPEIGVPEDEKWWVKKDLETLKNSHYEVLFYVKETGDMIEDITLQHDFAQEIKTDGNRKLFGAFWTKSRPQYMVDYIIYNDVKIAEQKKTIDANKTSIDSLKSSVDSLKEAVKERETVTVYVPQTNVFQPWHERMVELSKMLVLKNPYFITLAVIILVQFGILFYTTSVVKEQRAEIASIKQDNSEIVKLYHRQSHIFDRIEKMDETVSKLVAEKDKKSFSGRKRR